MTDKATKSDASLNIYARLIAAQSEFPKIEQDQKASTFGGGKGYAYADINSILSIVRPILNRHGLGVNHDVTSEPNRVGVETVIFSVDGETLKSPIFYAETTGLVQKGVQAYGSLVTYLRRYSLVSFLGIAYGVEDDDGLLAVDAHESHRRQQKVAPKPVPKAEAKPAINYADLERSAKLASLDGMEAYKKFFMALTAEEKHYLTESGAHELIKKEIANG